MRFLKVLKKESDSYAVILTVGTLSEYLINQLNFTFLIRKPSGHDFPELVSLFVLGCAEDFYRVEHDATSTLFLVAASVHGQ